MAALPRARYVGSKRLSVLAVESSRNMPKNRTAMSEPSLFTRERQPSDGTWHGESLETGKKERTNRREEAADDWKHAAVLVDKPQGWTSFDVCNKLKVKLKKRGVKKVGHAGTLDPMATGLLVVCTGTATKWIEMYMAEEKEYVGSIKLGESTPTGDSESAVDAEMPIDHVTDGRVAECAEEMVGEMAQAPPKYSAVKVNGEKLCDIARRGDPVPEAAKRHVEVKSFVVSREDPSLVRFRTRCSKGTYVRSLAEDLACRLGTVGHLVELRRTAIGSMSISSAWRIDELASLLTPSKVATS